MKNSYLLEQNTKTSNTNKNNKKESEVFNHLLIARIKDTSIMFSFIV